MNRTFFATLVLTGCTFAAIAQQSANQTPANPIPPASAPAAPAVAEPQHTPGGTVLFERHADPDAPAATPQPKEATAAPADSETTPAGTVLSDEERAALTVTAYDLDARIVPATAHLEMHAQITLHNDGATPLSRVALQISSTLQWQSATLLSTDSIATRTKLDIVQHLIDTDTDHTGKSNELVLDLPEPLAPGSSLTLDTFYSGTLPADGGRLQQIGASHDQAISSDWDAISPTATALRGFGNLLWYPVTSPQFFLGDGAKLFEAIAASRLREENATVHMRVALEYNGDPPAAVYFCGRRQPLVANSDNSDAPVDSGTGIATADFPAAPLGFRTLSLFVVEQPESLIAPLSKTSNSEKLLAVETTDDRALPPLVDSAQSLAPLLQSWFGVHPLSALTILDHSGQPFEDGPLLVAPVGALGTSTSAPALLHSLTYAWVQSGQPWMDEGLAEFMSLLYTEQQQGREAANAALRDMLRPLTLAEPAPEALTATGGTQSQGQPLIAAYDQLYYRRKAGAVWWALRSITGDESLQLALTIWRSQPVSHDSPRAQAEAFEHILEQTSHKDLAWFFNDWIFRDRGLPDLTITDVAPRLMEAGKGHETGWLVAVSVRNDGAAAAQVPLVVRSGDLSVTRAIRIPGLSTITERMIIEAKPTQVLVNDGSTPELRESQHAINVTVQVH